MFRTFAPSTACVAALAALICGAAAPKTAPKAAKPAPKPPAAAAAPAAGYLRDPATLIGIVSSLGGKAEIARREGDAVFLTVTAPAETFSAQFAGCDAGGRACQAVLFDRLGGQGAPTLSQLNAFNQTSMMCRLYQDKGGRPHVQYSALLFAKDGRPEMLTHINAWRGCIGDFQAFMKDPNGFLAGAP
jgi:hypothetical protein